MRFGNRERCLAGVVTAVLSASAASAEIFPAVVIGGVYHQTTSTMSWNPPDGVDCNPVGLCYAVFTRVPLGKQLIVTNTSCRLSVSQGGAPGTIAGAILVPQHPNGTILPRQQHLQPVHTEGFSFAFNNTTLLPFSERQRPLVGIFPGAGPAAVIAGVCSISGQISNAPP